MLLCIRPQWSCQNRRVSRSKVILKMKILYHALEHKVSNLHSPNATKLHEYLSRHVTDTAFNLKLTLLDPRFKLLGFQSFDKCGDAVSRLRTECAALMGYTTAPQPGPSSAKTSGMLFSVICLFVHLIFYKSWTKMPICCFLDNLW